MNPIDENSKIFNGIISKYLGSLQQEENPTMYILFGSPGSGKGRISDMIKKLHSYKIIETNVDDIISQFDDYKKNIMSCIDEFKNNKNEKKNNTEELIKECSDVYAKFKQNGDKINDQLIDFAITNKISFIFETTGFSIKWLIELLNFIKKTYNYKIVLYYPLVPLKTLINRIFTRAEQIGRVLNPTIVENNIPTINQNFVDLINRKIVDEFFIIDGTLDIKPTTNKDFKIILNGYLYNNNIIIKYKYYSENNNPDLQSITGDHNVIKQYINDFTK
jgi:predicted ABC-type ATPase